MSLLEKLRIKQEFTHTSSLSKAEFLEKFAHFVHRGTSSYFMFMAYYQTASSPQKKLRGELNNQGFEVRRIKRFWVFTTDQYFALATGTFHEIEGKFSIEVCINGLHWMFIIALIVMILILTQSVFFLAAFSLPFFLVAILTCCIWLFQIRESNRILKEELEDTFFMIEKNLTL
ncbi:MAG: hypothetical protein ACRCYO_14730 [Bacteroidia bacterium]